MVRSKLDGMLARPVGLSQVVAVAALYCAVPWESARPLGPGGVLDVLRLGACRLLCGDHVALTRLARVVPCRHPCEGLCHPKHGVSHLRVRAGGCCSWLLECGSQGCGAWADCAGVSLSGKHALCGGCPCLVACSCGTAAVVRMQISQPEIPARVAHCGGYRGCHSVVIFSLSANARDRREARGSRIRPAERGDIERNSPRVLEKVRALHLGGAIARSRRRIDPASVRACGGRQIRSIRPGHQGS